MELLKELKLVMIGIQMKTMPAKAVLILQVNAMKTFMEGQFVFVEIVK